MPSGGPHQERSSLLSISHGESISVWFTTGSLASKLLRVVFYMKNSIVSLNFNSIKVSSNSIKCNELYSIF